MYPVNMVRFRCVIVSTLYKGGGGGGGVGVGGGGGGNDDDDNDDDDDDDDDLVVPFVSCKMWQSSANM